MAVDIIARGLAAKGGGGSGDAYTKAETDALLAEKQPLITVQNKLNGDLVSFNLTEDDLVRLYNEARAEVETEYIIDGDNIKFLTEIEEDGNTLKFGTDSTFGYKNKIYL